MKRRTTPTLQVKIGASHSEITSIVFLFKQKKSEEATALVTKSYPSTSVSYDSENDLYLVAWTEADTLKFKADAKFYMDTKIVLTNGKIPETTIAELYMNETLFDGDE